MKRNFPTAREAAEKAAESWNKPTLEAIFKEIEEKCLNGMRSTCFFYCVMSKETEKTLKDLGYSCDNFKMDGTPGFKISW